MRKFWRGIRWGAFFLALAVDGYIFDRAVPFSTEAFFAAGIASLLMFLIFMKLANLIRGRTRIREFLEDGEKIRHQTGRHWVQLIRNIRADANARLWIGVPVLIALLTTVYFIFWGLWEWGVWRDALAPLYTGFADNRIAAAGYIPLVFAIPFGLAHVAEWSSHRYVITQLRVIIHSGIFDYHMHGILLSRVVDARQDYTFVQQLLNYGDIIFRETAGAEEKLECVWGPKKFAKIATTFSHAVDPLSPQGGGE